MRTMRVKVMNKTGSTSQQQVNEDQKLKSCVRNSKPATQIAHHHANFYFKFPFLSNKDWPFKNLA